MKSQADLQAIRLIDAQTIVTNWSISRRSESDIFEPIPLGRDTFLMLQPREVGAEFLKKVLTFFLKTKNDMKNGRFQKVRWFDY